ncbi:unnamed protein product [Larinioides sclopetarius]|uniref:DUF4781 domain-containing protein n=1 Tax=Larinioides sclopetarius TaxID=280406 RepID=A0AAV2A5T4_9ARAC
MSSLFPASIATPISEEVQATSASTVSYDTPQNATNVENLESHDQHIDSMEPEERMDRCRMVKIALNMAQSRMRASITQAAAAGAVKTKQQKFTQSVNTVVTLNDFISLVNKVDKRTPTEHDVHYFSAYFLFYSNKIFKKGTVGEIIKNIQEKLLNCHCDDLTEQQIDEFIKLSENVEGETQLHKNAKKIKAINHINDKQAFYQSLVIAKRDLENHHVQFSFQDPGLVSIDNELHIAPNKLVQISETDRKQILDATKKVNKCAMSNTVYWRNIEKILNNNRLKMQYQRRKAISQLKQAFNANNLNTIKIGNEQIFKNMTPSELDRLANVMIISGKNYDTRILKIVNRFAKMRHCKTPRDYCNYFEFIVKYVNELKRQKDAEYEKALNDAKVSKDFDTHRFARDYGIKGKRAVHFTNEVLHYFDTNPEECFNALEKLYTDLESAVLPLNANATPNFASDASAVCHYFKHSDFGSTLLTAEEYFNIAAELVSEPLNQRLAQLNQQGDKTMITFTNPINGAKGVVFETLADGAQSLATVFYDEKVLNQPD